MGKYILAIDQGTTSSRAILFDGQGQAVSVAQKEFAQHFPADGWVEHDPEEIWQSTLEVCRDAVKKSGIPLDQLKSIGITNQRETTLVWDRKTGQPVYPAIVWQDRRTAAKCSQLKSNGKEPVISDKTGLLVDPYFSATKIAWILDHVEGARQKAEAGELAFGTVDTFLLWRLTRGQNHATDASNASRTSLFNIHTQQWDDELLALFDVPRALLPEVKDSSDDFGQLDPEWLGAKVPVQGVAGDQQAALIGQACFKPGMAKSTYGTGCFLMLNTGSKAVRSENRLLTTVAYRLNGETSYAVEGSIFIAGAAVQWLRDELKAVDHARETQAFAEAVGEDNSVYLVPAFTGLGAPYWDPHARGAIMGLTRNAGIPEIVTAGLQSVCYQTKDLVRAAQNDGAHFSHLRVDGGMVSNDWVLQFLANVLNVPVDRPEVTETTALGAAYLAGLKCGVFESTDAIGDLWHLQRRFAPEMNPDVRERLYNGWLECVESVRKH